MKDGLNESYNAALARIAALEAERDRLATEVARVNQFRERLRDQHERLQNDKAVSDADLALYRDALGAIDRELYGPEPLNYNPNRALTIQAIKKLNP